MKTVKEVAYLLGVSQVTIYNHLKKNEKELKGNVVKKQGVTHIKDEGIRQLKISLGMLEVPEVKENISMEQVIDEIASSVKDDIKKDYGSIQEELKEVKEQNQDMKEQLNNLIELLQEEETEKSLWERIKDIFK